MRRLVALHAAFLLHSKLYPSFSHHSTAHEVRNPLASAMSALSFVSVGVAENVPDPQQKKTILDDVTIMDASLQFINELLRVGLESTQEVFLSANVRCGIAMTKCFISIS